MHVLDATRTELDRMREPGAPGWTLCEQRVPARGSKYEDVQPLSYWLTKTPVAGVQKWTLCPACATAVRELLP